MEFMSLHKLIVPVNLEKFKEYELDKAQKNETKHDLFFELFDQSLKTSDGDIDTAYMLTKMTFISRKIIDEPPTLLYVKENFLHIIFLKQYYRFIVDYDSTKAFKMTVMKMITINLYFVMY